MDPYNCETEERHLNNVIYACKVESLVREWNGSEISKGEAERGGGILKNWGKLRYEDS